MQLVSVYIYEIACLFLIHSVVRIGLWVMSGQACAGFCGPRYRWEEDAAEKRASFYSDNDSEIDAIPWSWREGTQLRLQEAYDFCLTTKPSPRWGGKKEISEVSELPRVTHSPAFEGMDRVMAAVGFPSSPPPARRGVLSGDLFDTPKEGSPSPEFSTIIPKPVKRASKEKNVAGPSGPLMALPYPFTGHKAQISSEDNIPIPFPPSPGPTDDVHSPTEESDEVGEEDDEEEEEEEELVAEEEPSSQSQGRTSGSMSSLGQPVSSRYPFQFRHPARGNSMSSAGVSHLSPQSRSSPSSRNSQSTQSTGNMSSGSPRSPGGSSVDPSSPVSSGYGSHIPMPPRHPQPTRGRPRAGTVPSALPSSPAPIMFPRTTGRPRARTRADSSTTEAFGTPSPQPGEDAEYSEEEELMEPPTPRSPEEVAEGEDSVGLLSAAPSPRTSLVGGSHRPTRRSRSSRTDSYSGSSSSRSRTGSAISARSRAQSLIQSLGAASRSSLELVSSMRTRANSSMARLEEDMSYNSDVASQAGSGSSNNENYTFGQPLLPPRESAEDRIEEVPVSRPDSPTHLRHSPSNTSAVASSEGPSQRTVSPSRLAESSGQPIAAGTSLAPSFDSQPDISTAAPSFVTDAATQEGTSESSDPTISSHAGISHMVDRSGSTWRPA